MSCKAYNEVWLLDGDGAYVRVLDQSIGGASSRSRRSDPVEPAAPRLGSPLPRSRTRHWLVFENREGSDGDPRPTEADVQALVKLREALGADATVVDAVILGERQLLVAARRARSGEALCAAGEHQVDGAGSLGPSAFSTCSSRRALQPAICTGGTV